MSTTPTTTPASDAPVRHELYVPGYRLAKLGMALLGVVLLGLSLFKLGPLAVLAFTGGSAQADAVAIIRVDGASETTYTSDADVLTAVKTVEDTWDRDSVFWVKYRFTTDQGDVVETLSPLGQHKKPLQMLRDTDGLPSTSRVWYDRHNPKHIVIPWVFGTWFMPGMLALFGLLGTFMGLLLWWNADKPIEMPDLSQALVAADKE